MSIVIVNQVELDASAGSSLSIVIGHFGRKKKKCLKGFGICKLFPKDVEFDDEGVERLERSIKKPHEDFYAAILCNEQASTLEIRFLEPIPHFEPDFYVDEGYPGVEREIRGVCGYKLLLPTLGRYRAQRPRKARHGLVTLDVLRGERRKARK